MKCPKCGHDVNLSGVVRCWCDKDNCMGQRCGADELFEKYECPDCGNSGTPPDTESYRKCHLND